ncbi:hypothetical protein EVAR_73164_1 [Eumeta japonica]|uniref:Uncharacterized protein n=1 Tax=Eumeta variegata TaxID=151549 RepID=A0A4C1TG85_EUMVA|nr:hypothetical protein EVAR_73164_1 [Eumeta japonica]
MILIAIPFSTQTLVPLSTPVGPISGFDFDPALNFHFGAILIPIPVTLLIFIFALDSISTLTPFLIPIPPGLDSRHRSLSRLQFTVTVPYWKKLQNYCGV